MTERCDWNPVKDASAMDPPEPGDCPNEATLSVGARENWHLCASCSERPAFRRLRRREPLPAGKPTT